MKEGDTLDNIQYIVELEYMLSGGRGLVSESSQVNKQDQRSRAVPGFPIYYSVNH